MRIVHVLHSVGYGGAENHAFILMKGQQAAGHDVLYAGRSDSWLAKVCREHGIAVLPLRMLGMNDISSLLKLRWHARRWHADIIHGHLVRGAKYAGLAGALRGRPVAVCTAHSDKAGKHMGHCQHIIAVSQAVQRNLLAHGYAADKISVIYNGIPDCAIEDRELLRRELGIPNDVYAVVHVGRFAHAKAQDLLLQASTHCPPQMHFYFIGDHQTEFGQRIHAEACDQSRIHFLGYRNDVQRLLPAFDAYALPSRREALGLSIVEASAAALPIVAASVGGVPEVVIDGQTGLLVPPQEPVAMAEALIRLQRDAALANRLGQNAREHYLSHFTVEEMVQSTLNVYRQSMGQPSV